MFCFKEQSLKVLEEIHVTTTIETLTLVLDIKGEHTLLILFYHAPGTIHNFITDSVELIENVLLTVNVTRILLLGDFNLSQMLQEIISKMDPLTQLFNLHQRSWYSPHVQGGILDLVLIQENQKVYYGFPRYIVTTLHFVLTFNNNFNAQHKLQFPRD